MNRVSGSRAAPRSRKRAVTVRGQRTRAALLQAAEELFGVRGYEATGIVDITRGAEVALGTFYVHFPDKKALFVELVDSLGSRLRQHLHDRVVAGGGRLERERLGLEAFLEFVAEHRHLYRIVRQADFVDQACFRRYYRRMAEGYVRGLSEAIDKHEIRRLDPEVLCYCLMGVADFLGMRWVLWEKKPRAGVLDDAMAFIERGLAPERRRP